MVITSSILDFWLFFVRIGPLVTVYWARRSFSEVLR
jgi:hypothetical protein